MKAYMIDREDVRQSLQVIVNVSNDVKNGRNFLIFPEGTRSRQGNQVQDFKGGSFKSIEVAVNFAEFLNGQCVKKSPLAFRRRKIF